VKENLSYAFELLQQAKPTTSGDSAEPFSQDLYVIFAELAFKNGPRDQASEILKMFLSRSPPANQFLCRAYLCQAQLVSPKSSDQFDEFEKSIVYLLKAIAFAKDSPRYFFVLKTLPILPISSLNPS